MEIHKIISSSDIRLLLEAEAGFIAEHPGFEVCFRRYFLSSAEQVEMLGDRGRNTSLVIQPVLGEDRVAVWIYLTKDCPVTLLWHTNLCSTLEGPESQTREILENYERELEAYGLNISDNCIRTWFYVDDIDNNYPGVVVGRRENFEKQGMTASTHYLASTGINGWAVKKGTSVQMDALAIKGDFSQRYLYAPDNFNPTHEYGVTFERGTVVEYGGESHIFISGTASIDNRGRIVHPGDVAAQTLRMWDNMEALLHEAGCGWEEVRMMVVYLRNAEDYGTVEPLFSRRFGPDIPYVITHAPVCRPGWLIEMECIATVL